MRSFQDFCDALYKGAPFNEYRDAICKGYIKRWVQVSPLSYQIYDYPPSRIYNADELNIEEVICLFEGVTLLLIETVGGGNKGMAYRYH